MSHVHHKPDYYLRLVAGTLFAMCLLAFTQTMRVSSNLLVANAAKLQTYYISSDGSDAHSGVSQENPWQSIAPVYTMAHAGDTVLFNQNDVFSGLLETTIANTNPKIKVGYYSPKL